VKAQIPLTGFTLWRSEALFNIDFAGYTLSHHSFARHFHDHYVIELVIKGADSFYCDGRNYTAYGNQLVLINPGEVHTGSTVSDIPLQYFSLYPDRKTMQQVAEAMDITIAADFKFYKTLQNESVLTNRLQCLFNSFITGADIWKQQEIFFDCMHALLQQQPVMSGKGCSQRDARVDLLIDFIHTHFKDDISLQRMADLAALNPFHLIRLFKKNTGLSPYDYLLIVRTEHARKLLRTGRKVQDAAQEAGFYDTSHLNRSLRKITGTSPRSFLLSKGQYRTTLNQ
jgi:AraC-like DNA-binding protein